MLLRHLHIPFVHQWSPQQHLVHYNCAVNITIQPIIISIKHIIYLSGIIPATYTHFSFQQAIIKIREQKNIPFQLQLIVTESLDINPITDIHNFNYKHEVQKV